MTKGEVSQRVAEVLERAGLHTGAHAEAVKLALKAGGVESIIVYYRGDAAFETLQHLSEAFRTSRIDLGVAIHGPEEVSVAPYLRIHSPTIPGLEGPIER